LLERVAREIFRLRTRLLFVNALLVAVPLIGLEFARTYERELLRQAEESMVVVARALAAGQAAGLDVSVYAAAAAENLRAQIRILGPDGKVRLNTGAERFRMLTRGRQLISSTGLRHLGDIASYGRGRVPAPQLVAGDPDPPGGDFSARPEVKKALSGQRGRMARKPAYGRGVRLYVAEPVVQGGAAPAEPPGASASELPSRLPVDSLGTAATPDGPPPPVLGAIYVSRSTYPVLVSLYRIRNGLLRVAIGSLVVALLVAIFLAVTLVRPVERLRQAALRIARGERGVALKAQGRDEIAELSRAFDTMAGELDARLAYIGELAANVSHEFKTPIASIRGAAELLREGAAMDPAARERFLGNILADTERLGRLISRLLELSRIEAHLEPKAPVDYRALVLEVVDRHASAGQPVTAHFEAAEARLVGRADHLEAAVTCLIDNALRFSPPGAAVEVRVSEAVLGGQHGEARRPALCTRVIDRGTGISQANLPRIWERFFTTDREAGGTGLGLAIVKAIAESHGGEVAVVSAPGKGSTFTITLPLRA
jgi:two-component system sensor histidine kinase ChvG